MNDFQEMLDNTIQIQQSIASIDTALKEARSKMKRHELHLDPLSYDNMDECKSEEDFGQD